MNNWKLTQILTDIERFDKEIDDLYSMKTAVFNSSMYPMKVTGVEGRRNFGHLYTPSRDIIAAICDEIQAEVDTRKAKRDALEARIDQEFNYVGDWVDYQRCYPGADPNYRRSALADLRQTLIDAEADFPSFDEYYRLVYRTSDRVIGVVQRPNWVVKKFISKEMAE